ncbi:FG-GAP-like repeat-containing protein [Streptomyces avidinii]|uniref:FG-GAP-like repeat-containing protein n=1 Tax=Streptomyces avidinii TaxID=1895 RepID=UPI00386E5C28|nr:FG-GAP-like repeat-containing protein [Streptomyces avidinii]
MSVLRPRPTRMTGLVATATAVTAGLITAGPVHALTGPEVPSGLHAAVVKLTIGDETNGRACTGTLVDEWWVATAASCFAATAGQQVPAGKPATPATVALASGQTFAVTELAPRADRDLVLARLALPARGAATVKVGAAAPVAGTDLTAAGYGRTRTEWVPGRPHSGAFTAGTSDATTVAITGKGTDAICKGDTGGPLLNAAGELVGVNSRSWQGGCLGTDPAEKRTGAISARVDDIAQWITEAIEPRRSAAANEAGGSERIRWADFDGDRKPDYIDVADNGEVAVWLNRGGDPAGAAGWQSLGRVATSLTQDRSRVRFADFDGDGRADCILVNGDGSVTVFRNEGGDGRGGWKDLGKVARGVTNDPSKVRFADWDGDGRTDYLAFDDGGGVTAYLNRGGDTAGGQGWPSPGKVTTGSTRDRARVRFADNDGDGRADYFIVKPDGKVDLYLNRGGDVVPNAGWNVVGQIATGLTTDHTKVQFVDFDADTHADYVLAGAGNSATVHAWNGGDKGNGWIDLGRVASGT